MFQPGVSPANLVHYAMAHWNYNVVKKPAQKKLLWNPAPELTLSFIFGYEGGVEKSVHPEPLL